MPLNAGGAVVRMRLAILFLAITWLAVASLSSATRFAVVLPDRAKSNLVTPSDAVLDITFQNDMVNILRRHGDCGPQLSRAFHLRASSCDPPAMAKSNLEFWIRLTAIGEIWDPT